MLLASLHQGKIAKHLPDGFAQGLAPVDDEQEGPLAGEAPCEEIGQQRSGDTGVLGRALAQPQNMLVSLPIQAQRHEQAAGG
ncbi:hypothetical protein BMS3Abin12_01080 [bacterium BMS3Abin12]|nr:hypothetical protein BMS3Abin12_01080 [bacterium BMS3Abin12]